MNNTKNVSAPAASVVVMVEPDADFSPPIGSAPDDLAIFAGRVIDDDFDADDLDNEHLDDDIFEDDRPLTPETRANGLWRSQPC